MSLAPPVGASVVLAHECVNIIGMNTADTVSMRGINRFIFLSNVCPDDILDAVYFLESFDHALEYPLVLDKKLDIALEQAAVGGELELADVDAQGLG